jgi:hypothetical protein
MSVAEISNLVIYKGTDFSATFNLFNPDSSAAILSGLTTSYAKIRKHPTSTNYQEFSKTIASSTGTITLSLTSTQTEQLSEGRNYFDVILTLYEQKTSVLKGTAMVYESASV